MRQSRSKMEDDSQKLMALKKAYADMLLSMAKEAAVRVMASERKASKYESELLVVKEEALRLLLRLKHSSDAKISETETILRSQQKRVEVLEAQLEAAEKVVKELREEIKEMSDLPANRCRQLHKECATCLRSKPQDLVLGSRVSTSTAGEYAPSTSRNESAVSGTNICHNSICNGCHSDSADKAGNYYYSAYCESETKGFHKVNYPIFESRGLKRIESDGYTQKVQDCGRNLWRSDSSKCDVVQEGKMDKCMKTGSVLSMTANQSMDIQFLLDDTPDEARRIGADVIGFVGSSAMKKKRSVRHRKQTTTSFSEMHGLDVKGEQACGIAWPNNLMNQPVTVPSIRATTDVKLINGLVDAANRGEALAEEDAKQEYKVNGNLIGPACVSTCKTNIGWPKTEKQNFTSNWATNMSLENKFLKYTFQRKRKKEPLLKIDGKSIHGMTSKKKPPASLEEKNVTAVSDDSRDREQLMHVAQQLLSLSEKTFVKSAGPRN